MTPIAAICVVACGLMAMALFRANRRLRDSLESFEVLATRAPIGILRADPTGMCTFVNEAWQEISGLSRRESLGRAWSQAVHPDDLPGTMRQWEESVRERRPYSHELRLLRPDGSVRRVLAGACPMHDADGRVTGFIGTVLDITDRLAAEKKARENDSFLRTLAEHSTAAIYLKDRAGRYLMMNRAHVAFWPSLAAFTPGSTPFEWFPEETARSFIASDAEVIRTGKTLTFEESIPLPGGPHTFLTSKFPVFDDSGSLMAVGGISTDISVLEATRRELAGRERLLRTLIEVQEAEKRQLCHEFHDGLIQYAVGSKMLLESLRTVGLPPDCMPTVESVIRYLAAGIEDGRRVIRGIRPAVLDDLGLGPALDDLADEVRDSGIAIDVALDDSLDALPPPLQTTVYRIVQESLTNARRHSKADRLRLQVSRSADALLIEVEDFGTGFDPAATVGKGFGLVGLRERIRLAGGECAIETEPGRGTRVSARLPLEPAETTQPDQAPLSGVS